MKMRTLPVIVLVLLAASLLSRGLLRSVREPEVYDPSGGPLAVDGISIGMSYGEVAQATGQKPGEAWSTILVSHAIPGMRLEPLVEFDVPEGGTLQDATVDRIDGSVLTQGGRILLDFHSVSKQFPSKSRDIVAALGQPSNVEGPNLYYYPRDLELYIVCTEHDRLLAGRLKLIRLMRSDKAVPPTVPDPGEGVKQ